MNIRIEIREDCQTCKGVGQIESEKGVMALTWPYYCSDCNGRGFHTKYSTLEEFKELIDTNKCTNSQKSKRI